MTRLLVPIARFCRGDECPPVTYHFGEEEAERRLRNRIVPSLSGFGCEGFRGSVRNGRISLYWRAPGFGNSCPAVFRGAIVSIEGGCRIEGRISKFRFRTVGAYLCFGLAALFVGHRTPTVTFSIVAVAVAVLGTASITLFQRVSYLERKKILSELGRL